MAVKTKKPAGVKVKRPRKPKVDSSPKWDNHEAMSANAYHKHFRDAMQYYNQNFSGKELKPKVINWMGANGFDTKIIKAFKATHDWRTSSTMGGIAANLTKGMPTVREDFNQGRDVAEWLTEAIHTAIKNGANDNPPKASVTKQKVSIQDRLREVAINMADELEDAYESFMNDPAKFNVKEIKVLNMLRTKEAKAAHARIIRNFYATDYDEVQRAISGKDEDLADAYSHLKKSQLKKLYEFLKEIDNACVMLMQEAKITRAPRAKKPKSKDKLIEKLNFKTTDESLTLVSIKPIDILGASELWVYNTKTRKIGKYVAAEIDPQGQGREGTGLGIKGTTIIGFDEKKSIQKTLRKPKEQLPKFKSAGKVKLRRFLTDIKAVDIKLNGRINNDIILLKVSK